MAQEVQIKILLDTADAANNIGDIRKSIKSLQSEALSVGEGGSGFDSLNKKAAELKDKLDDLGDSAATLRGSGIEKLQGSMGMLKEGFTNADPGKLSIGMKGLGMAMKAIPIFLIIEGIKWLIENFDKLKNSGGLLGKVFKAIGDVIGWLVQQLKDFTDWLGITSFAADELAEKQIENNKAVGASNQTRYDDEIALAKAAGKNVTELEKKKQQDIIDTAKAEYEIIKATAAAKGEVTDEQMKRIGELGKTVHDATLAMNVAEITNETKKKDEKIKLNKEYSDKAKIEAQKQSDWEDQNIKEGNQRIKDENAKLIADLASEKQAEWDRQVDKDIESFNRQFEAEKELTKMHNEETFQGKLLQMQIEKDALLANTELSGAEREVIEEKYRQNKAKLEEDQAQKSKELRDKDRQSTLSTATALTNSLGSLSDIFFSIKKRNLEKGSKEELAAAKKQFNLNKALSISSAIITGIQSVMAAISNGMKNPVPLLGPATAAIYGAIAGVTAAANVAKIAATKFDGGGSVSASVPSVSPSVPELASPEAANKQNLNNYSLFGTAGSKNNLGPGNQTQQVQAYVLESDVSNTQKRVSKFKSASEL